MIPLSTKELELQADSAWTSCEVLKPPTLLYTRGCTSSESDSRICTRGATQRVYVVSWKFWSKALCLCLFGRSAHVLTLLSFEKAGYVRTVSELLLRETNLGTEKNSVRSATKWTRQLTVLRWTSLWAWSVRPNATARWSHDTEQNRLLFASCLARLAAISPGPSKWAWDLLSSQVRGRRWWLCYSSGSPHIWSTSSTAIVRAIGCRRLCLWLSRVSLRQAQQRHPLGCSVCVADL